MDKRIVAAIAFGALLLAGRVRAEDAPAAPAADAEVTFPFDKGPDAIDVSTYPAVQQENYKVFAEKCSKCHTLARPINAPFATHDEWAAYVDKMRHKKRSGVDEDSAKIIIDFLTYDSYHSTKCSDPKGNSYRTNDKCGDHRGNARCLCYREHHRGYFQAENWVISSPIYNCESFSTDGY